MNSTKKAITNCSVNAINITVRGESKNVVAASKRFMEKIENDRRKTIRLPT